MTNKPEDCAKALGECVEVLEDVGKLIEGFLSSVKLAGQNYAKVQAYIKQIQEDLESFTLTPPQPEEPEVPLSPAENDTHNPRNEVGAKGPLEEELRALKQQIEELTKADMAQKLAEQKRMDEKAHEFVPGGIRWGDILSEREDIADPKCGVYPAQGIFGDAEREAFEENHGPTFHKHTPIVD